MKRLPTLPALLESFFTQRLMAQRQASPHTIASYRDTFRLLLDDEYQCENEPGGQASDNNASDMICGHDESPCSLSTVLSS